MYRFNLDEINIDMTKIPNYLPFNDASRVLQMPAGTKVFFLDDENIRFRAFQKASNRKLQIDWVKTVNHAKSKFAVDKNNYDIIMIDHDLSDRETTLPFVEWLIKNHKDMQNIPIIVHSHSIWGAPQLQYLLKTAGFNKVHQIPFSRIRLDIT